MANEPPPLTPGAPPPLTPDDPNLPPASGSSGNGGKVAIGCGVGCLAVLVVGGIIAYFIFTTVKTRIAEGVENYTAVQPVAIEPPRIAENEIEDAIARFDAFRGAMDRGEQAAPLVLTDDDINALLFHHPSFKEVAGKTKVSIENDQLKSTVSLNLDDLEIPVKFIADAVEGKYFNGEVTLSIDMVAGRPTAFIENLEVNGMSPPEEAMAAFGQENLLKEARTDPEMKKFFDKIEELEIENNRLVIVPKSN
ncbi:MAG: hypothetical protein WD342_16625 [Verrucomicrobiales bacterium]